MKSLEKLIISLGGTKVNEIKNTMTPSFLYRFANNLYITIEYDKRDQYKSVELGRLFLMKDVFPRLIVLEDFELLLKAANSIRLPVTYKFNYSLLSYEQMIENVICNLKIVLENYEQLYLISKSDFELKEKMLEKYLIKDVSLLSIQEIEKETSKIIYKPKKDEIKYTKLTHHEKKLKEENDTYTPDEGITGGDSFTYAATDTSGKTSAPATVTVTIQKTRSGVTYADTDAKSAYAAQEMAEKGLFVGAKIGDQYYFEPDRAVSRSEFLAMTMEMTGRDVTAVTMTGFSDDAAIPTWAKAYAAAGVADGIVQGTATETGVEFRGEDSITFNEAAALLNRVLATGDVDLDTWYGDRESVPTWASQAVGNLEAVNVLRTGSFGSDTMSRCMTRADAAEMLTSAAVLLAGEEPNTLFGWLK